MNEINVNEETPMLDEFKTALLEKIEHILIVNFPDAPGSKTTEITWQIAEAIAEMAQDYDEETKS